MQRKIYQFDACMVLNKSLDLNSEIDTYLGFHQHQISQLSIILALNLTIYLKKRNALQYRQAVHRYL